MLIRKLIEESSLETVQFYMHAIQRTAEQAVRSMLRDVNKRFGGQVLEAVDQMDDGTQIKLRIEIDAESGGATFDFTGTSPQTSVS